MSSRITQAALVLLFVFPIARNASAATDVPPFPDDGVAIADVADVFDDLRSFLAAFESEAGTSFHIAIVANSDPYDRAGVDYGDASGDYIDSIVVAWLPLIDDPANSVIIALAIENREVLVQPGASYVQMGFSDDAVDDVVQSSRFVTHARTGDYDTALQALVSALDGQIAELLREEQYHREDATEALPILRDRLQALRQGMDEADFSLSSIEEDLIWLEGRLDEAEQYLEQDRMGGRAFDAVTDASYELDLAEELLADRSADLHFKTRTLPAIGFILLAIVLIFVVAVRRARTAHFRALANEELGRWEKMLGTAGTRMLDLQNEHAVLLGESDLVERFGGETAEPVGRVAAKVDELFMMYEVACNFVKEVKQTLDSAGSLNKKKAVEAWMRLSGDVIIEDAAVGPIRLFLSEHPTRVISATELLQNMDSVFSEALKEVETLETQCSQVWQRLDEIQATLLACEEIASRLDEIAVMSEQMMEELTEGQQTQAQLKSDSERDPFGAAASVANLAEITATLLQRYERLDKALTIAQKVPTRLEETMNRIAELRASKGMRLTEPGFEPEIMGDHVEASIRDCYQSTEDGEDERALMDAEEAEDLCEELDGLIEETLKSKENSSTEIKEQTKRHQRLTTPLPEKAKHISDLRKCHADEALQPALDNVDEAKTALEYAITCLNDATAAVSETEQRYLGGAELIKRAVGALDDVEDLFAEIGEKGKELAEHRSAAEKFLSRLKTIVRELERELADNNSFASEFTKRVADKLRQLLDQSETETQAEKPNWLMTRQRLETGTNLAEEVLERANAERAAYDAARELQPKVEAKVEGIQIVLDSSEEDRQPANDSYQSARQALTEAAAAREDDDLDWLAILAFYQQADRSLDEARTLAETDFSAAEQARNAIAKAETSIRQANRSYGHGVVAVLTASEARLTAAKEALAAHQYEKGASEAAGARLSAERAASNAQSQARQKADAARQRSFSSSSWGGSSSSWGSSRSRSRSRSSSSSSRSSFGSSSGRSSFRSSSRSSFGRSSSRSSYSRSSSRSKW